MNQGLKMKIEVWSDVMCTYCYIAKRQFEKALAKFPQALAIDISWRSFQIAPGLKSEPHKSFYQSLCDNTGMTLEQAKLAGEKLAASAAMLGLVYDFDRIVPANTLRAHEFSHFAKKHGKQNEAEETLMKAYFTEGRNIDSIPVLGEIALELGLNNLEAQQALESGVYTSGVALDLEEARTFGISSVPLYIFNGKHKVSGAVDSEEFLRTLEIAYFEWLDETREQSSSCMHGQCSIGL